MGMMGSTAPTGDMLKSMREMVELAKSLKDSGTLDTILEDLQERTTDIEKREHANAVAAGDMAKREAAVVESEARIEALSGQATASLATAEAARIETARLKAEAMTRIETLARDRDDFEREQRAFREQVESRDRALKDAEADIAFRTQTLVDAEQAMESRLAALRAAVA